MGNNDGLKTQKSMACNADIVPTPFPAQSIFAETMTQCDNVKSNFILPWRWAKFKPLLQSDESEDEEPDEDEDVAAQAKQDDAWNDEDSDDAAGTCGNT